MPAENDPRGSVNRSFIFVIIPNTGGLCVDVSVIKSDFQVTGVSGYIFTRMRTVKISASALNQNMALPPYFLAV